MSKLLPYRRLWNNGTFTLFFCASLISNLAQSIAVITIIWYVYQQTANAWFIALSLLCLELPAMLVAPIWGIVLDRYKTTHMVAFANVSRALLFGFLIISSTQAVHEFLVFFILLALSSSLAPIVKSGENMMLYRIVDTNELLPANSMMNIQFDLAYVIGPIIGGIVAASSLGKFSFAINVVLLLISAVMYGLIRLEQPASATKQSVHDSQAPSTWQQLKEGLLFVIHNKLVLALVVVSFFWNLLIWGTSPTLLPMLANRIGGSFGYGVLMAATSLGIIAGSFIIGLKKVELHPFMIVLFSIGAHGLLYALLGFPFHVYTLVVILVLAGFISAPAMIYNRTMFQLLVPPEKQGRVFTLISTAGALGFPLGTLIAAQLSSSLGSERLGLVFIGCGALLILSTVLAGFLAVRKVKVGAEEPSFEGA